MSSSSPSPSSSQQRCRVALLQFGVTPSKSKNHETAATFLSRAADQKADIAVLPEIWNGPYATAAFAEYAETLPDVGDCWDDIGKDSGDDDDKCPSATLLMKKAKEYGMWIVGGSVPERVTVPADDGSSSSTSERIYNTCLCINPDGEIVGKHRKVHLFDIDVPGKIRFKESDTLTPGGSLTTFDTGDLFGKIGVGICYDIRFPELSQCLTSRGCRTLIFPGAFNLVTGPAHWELLQRGRAVDNQCFILTASPARTEDDGTSKYPHYAAWGHSTAVSPWGEVLATCDEGEALVVVDLDMGMVDDMRRSVPTGMQKRGDLYVLSDLMECGD